jgi:hypothetical protein
MSGCSGHHIDYSTDVADIYSTPTPQLRTQGWVANGHRSSRVRHRVAERTELAGIKTYMGYNQEAYDCHSAGTARRRFT